MFISRKSWPLVFLLAAGISCQPAPTTSPPQASAKIEATGLHNVYRITDKLYSGSSPDGEDGFRSLQKLGIQTVISVDGAKPEVETAHKYGMRYVHLPIGYDGVPEDQGLRLARAVRDLPGPVYIHCHHGKHRGPAAAAVIHLCLDEQCTVQTALDEMSRAGTDPRYTGLYDSSRKLRRPNRDELDRVSAEFPETAPVPAFAQTMVVIDECWDRLKEVRAAGWKAPPAHPDVEPAHEALQLREHYREAGRLPSLQGRAEEMRRWLDEADMSAGELEQSLRQGKPKSVLEESYNKSAAACTRCHAKYRDIPQPR
jgi:protein tyrosine phosphatase (PTP) superfamily phosphohydrolase (DUF442 family)